MRAQKTFRVVAHRRTSRVCESSAAHISQHIYASVWWRHSTHCVCCIDSASQVCVCAVVVVARFCGGVGFKHRLDRRRGDSPPVRARVRRL